MIRPGRNQPCHCGNDLKYKRCCLRGDRETEHFLTAGNLERAFTYSPPRLLATLERSGLSLTAESFVAEARQAGSSHRLAESWDRSLRPNTHESKTLLRTAATSLWSQLLPGEPCWELLELEIYRGYGLADEDTLAGRACWWAVWKQLQPRFEAEMTTVAATTSVFGDSSLLSTWICDFARDLFFAADFEKDAAIMGERFCGQLLEQFTDQNETWTENMRACQAEFAFCCGREHEAIELAERLIEDRPDHALGYACLAEILAEHSGPRPAIEILERGLQRSVQDAAEYDLRGRIEELRQPDPMLRCPTRLSMSDGRHGKRL